MALPLPDNKQILITYKKLPGDYKMPSLEAAYDHYTLGLLIHGDRRVITPNFSYELHEGSVNALSPFVYHQSIPASKQYYELILIKFTKNFIKPLTDKFGVQILDQLFEIPCKTFSKPYDKQVQALFWNMLTVQEDNDAFSEFTLQCMLCELMLLIYRKGLQTDQTPLHPTTLTKPIFDAIFYMEMHYCEHITIEQVAKLSGYSIAYFSRLFQSQLGHSFTEYLTSIRMRYIKSELLTTDKSITSIALDAGYNFPGNMSSLFKLQTGLTPYEYRKKNRTS